MGPASTLRQGLNGLSPKWLRRKKRMWRRCGRRGGGGGGAGSGGETACEGFGWIASWRKGGPREQLFAEWWRRRTLLATAANPRSSPLELSGLTGEMCANLAWGVRP
eukprot:2086147-Pyramimonas_sp.AAC.1